MSININDSPWHRLPWTLSAALTIGFTTLWIIAYFVDQPTQRLPPPPSIEAQIVEIPAPPTAKKTAAPHKPSPHKPSPPKHPIQPNIKKTSVLQSLPVKQATPEHDVTPPSPAATTPTPTTAPVKSGEKSNLTDNSGAQAISRPMPQIPDELRQDALNETAVARFHVAIDGTVTVKLIKPTQNPRLNRLLLETLKHWRFFPAMKNGHPVASTQELSIKVNIQ
ncbi:MAG: TonB family protein [Gallionella sp.]